MIKLKYVHLKNYCGYRDFELDLTDENGVKRCQLLCGPNGAGKSNFIRAIHFLSSPRTFVGRENSLVLRKLKYNKNYIVGTEALLEKVENLYMEGIFSTKEGEKKIIIEDTVQGQLSAKNRNNPENGISGITFNELPQTGSISLYIDADHPMNMNKFQIPTNLKDPFLSFAESVYGFHCDLPEGSVVVDSGISYYKDFVLEKYQSKTSTKVHFKRFSDGEKKIAALLSSLFNDAYEAENNENNIILIDNIDLHIYWKRHMLLIEKMNEFFPNHQIIASTHSPVIIQQIDKKYLCDLEEYIY